MIVLTIYMKVQVFYKNGESASGLNKNKTVDKNVNPWLLFRIIGATRVGATLYIVR